ncbi:MAG: hypothetical protein QOD53_1966 [Thermoleophilaceae bacterium]|nr:hypothetical protein [Thermoleophilaceae bacterium]
MTVRGRGAGGPTARVLAATACALATIAAGASQAQAASGDPAIRVLSGRADLVSDGDAYVQVVLPAGARASKLKLDLDGKNVGSAFAVRADGRYTGLIKGLRVGRNVLTARLPGDHGARLTLVNHPIGGPVTAGPQIQPWTCFAGALDAQCNRPPSYAYSYKSTAGGPLQSYDPQNPPSDVATTTTDQGRTVPFIVRQETGELDRDEYRIAVLYDPSKPWAPYAPQAGFNHKLVVFHGFSCDTGYAQAAAPDVMSETALGRGFITMSHALDNAGHNCNIATQAEALIMTKEHLIDTYGDIRYTNGSGCSGGSLVQQQVANAYPGFYQGITPACSFTDAWSSAMQYVDYQLLRRYYENPGGWAPGVVWDPTSIQAVEGHPSPVNSITFTTVIPSSGDPSRMCPGVPADKVYDENTNPKGVRCSFQDYMVNVFGRRPKDGFAQRPFDNVGIEYGRKGLMAGKVTPSQFADLNVKIGAADIDYNPTTTRTTADRPALERVYRSGAVDQADNLDKVAIIDLRGPDPGAFHDVYRTYVMRARLDREHHTHANQILWRGQVPLLGDANYADQSIIAMDSWLAVIEKDKRHLPLAQKVIKDKPASVQDRCTNGSGQDAPASTCDASVQAYSDPRLEAGMPKADDTIKCQLKPLRRDDYKPVVFSDADWAKMKQAFPQGVCGYDKPGVDRVHTVPWLSYQDANGRVVYGGRPLGAVPRSKSLVVCASRRKSVFKIHQPPHGRVVAVSAFVNGKRVKHKRGHRVRKLVLRGLPKGVFTVRIVATTNKHSRTTSTRRYRGCKKGKPHTVVTHAAR